MRRIFLPYFFFAVFALIGNLAHAQSLTDWQSQEELSARLISGDETVGNGTVTLGLEVKLQPNWKTYWRTPGAAGLPLSIDWSQSQNVAAADIQWPAPKRYEEAGLMTFGYADHVIFPITMKADDATQPLVLNGEVEIMVCNTLCVPRGFTFNLTLPPGAAETSFQTGDIALWQSRVPSAATAHDVAILSAVLQDDTLVVEAKAEPPLKAPELLVEAVGNPIFAAPVQDAANPNQLRAKLVGTLGTKPLKSGDTLRITLIDGPRMVDQTVGLAAMAGTAAPDAPAPGIATYLEMLVIAFIGGLILNLMPCVLPVLSLKLFTLMQHGDAPPRHIRMSFLASALGILTSFAALAALMIGMKMAGMQVGWGMQFQEPWFILFMMAVLGLFAATLWDFIHIPLPRFLMDAVSDRLPRPGESDHTVLGNFMTGAFATLLATPCSAPFVGTAVGFALGGSAVSIAIIFLAMGLGLAAPYLLVAAFPRLARFLPRPGRWMGMLRAFLGFALLATAMWLGSVLQAEWKQNAIHITGALLTMLFILWLRHCISNPRMLPKGIVAITLAVLAAIYIPPYLEAPPSGIRWQQFDEAAIPRLVAEGKTVLVDVTADWCLTCKVNERMVLEQPEVANLINQPNIVAMRADFTSRDEKIFAYLQKFKRYGIPFNAIYAPGKPEALLPELLTVTSLQTLLAKTETAP